MARHGMIATSQPLASAAGLRVLHEGGNAIDAAVTAAAVLSVVEPTMNGIGGDLFAIVYDAKTKRLRGAERERPRAGRRPRPRSSRRAASTTMPERGALSVTVPGVVDGWSELLTRHGTITLARALAAGDRLRARRVRRVARSSPPVEGKETMLAPDPAAARDVPAGRPRAGAGARSSRTRASPPRSSRLREGGRDAFYRGPIAAGDRRRHAAPRRAARRGGPRGAPLRLGRADLDDLPRLRRIRAAARTPRASSRSRC